MPRRIVTQCTTLDPVKKPTPAYSTGFHCDSGSSGRKAPSDAFGYPLLLCVQELKQLDAVSVCVREYLCVCFAGIRCAQSHRILLHLEGTSALPRYSLMLHESSYQCSQDRCAVCVCGVCGVGVACACSCVAVTSVGFVCESRGLLIIMR